MLYLTKGFQYSILKTEKSQQQWQCFLSIIGIYLNVDTKLLPKRKDLPVRGDDATCLLLTGTAMKRHHFNFTSCQSYAGWGVVVVGLIIPGWDGQAWDRAFRRCGKGVRVRV